MNELDEKYMRIAMEQAKLAETYGEVPVGAVIVKDEKIISVGRNFRESRNNALAHAEIEAIDGACKALGGWRLFGCTLYVTLEPCPMCAGAIINARLDRVVFGAFDWKAGSVCSVQKMFDFPYNHKPEFSGGVLEAECSALLTGFFKKLRT